MKERELASLFVNFEHVVQFDPVRAWAAAGLCPWRRGTHDSSRLVLSESESWRAAATEWSRSSDALGAGGAGV